MNIRLKLVQVGVARSGRKNFVIAFLVFARELNSRMRSGKSSESRRPQDGRVAMLLHGVQNLNRALNGYLSLWDLRLDFGLSLARRTRTSMATANVGY